MSLWVNNDEGLYSIARNCVRCYRGAKESAARHMVERLKDEGITETPDGAKYSVTAVLVAMRGM